MTGVRETGLVGRPDAMRARLLDARTRRLARPVGDAGPLQAAPPVLVCALGDSLYGLPLTGIARVFPFQRATPLPGQPPAMLGVAGRAGALYHVFDLAAWLAGGAAGAGAGFAVAVRRPAPLVALRVDGVPGVAPATALSAAEAAHLRSAPTAVSGYARTEGTGALDGRLLALLDLDRLLSSLTLPPS